MTNKPLIASALCLVSLLSLPAKASLVIPDIPMYANRGGTPMVMLVVARDHTLHSEAYSDLIDLNNDGQLDTHYITDTNFKYYGYFNSGYCYKHENSEFVPVYATNDKQCLTNTAEWSGDFLNYVTTSRIDALRKVLYGGKRTAENNDYTLLEAGYIPQDGHAWGKSYDKGQGYNIANYTSIADVSADTRADVSGRQDYIEKVFFAVSSNADNTTPTLKYIRIKTGNYTKYIWNWVSKERVAAKNTLALEKPIADATDNYNFAWGCTAGTAASPNKNPFMTNIREDFCDGVPDNGFGGFTELPIKVRVCVSNIDTADCEPYGTQYRPVGLLQKYQDKIKFGLLTGSYSNNKQGGVLRKAISYFSDEINQTDGKFNNNMNSIVYTLNKLIMLHFSYTDFKHQTEDNADNGNTALKIKACGYNGFRLDQSMKNGECVSWGNPLAEMLAESLRYFAGNSTATTEFTYSNPVNDGGMGDRLSQITTWTDPFAGVSSGVATCNKASNLIISDVNPNFDGDNLPTDLPGASDIPDWTDKMSSRESLEANYVKFTSNGSYFIGSDSSTAATDDGSPTVKSLASLKYAKGLPQEASKGGTYNTAGLAYYAHTRGVGTNPRERVIDTYALGLSSPLPEIKIQAGTHTVTLWPYAKTVSHCTNYDGKSSNHDCIHQAFQPTASIVDFYVTEWTPTSGKFRVTFDDTEQGSDYDMDIVVLYEYSVGANDSVTVTVSTEYSSAALGLHAGYVISGTNKDGLYLDVRKKYSDNATTDATDAKAKDWRYVLDTPSAADSPYPNNTAGRPGNSSLYNLPTSGKDYPIKTDELVLPLTRTRTFTAVSGGGALLPSPLWFAAKWGGYTGVGATDYLNTNTGIQREQWSTLTPGEPDNYSSVRNIAELPTKMKNIFDKLSGDYSGAGVEISDPVYDNSDNISASERVYQTLFYPETWYGDLVAYNISDGALGAVAWHASLPAYGARKIYAKNSSGTVVEFTSGNFNADPGLGGWSCPATASGCNKSQQIDYLRGDTTHEIVTNGNATTGYLRSRKGHLLGDIIGSKPVYGISTDNVPFVVVGANDGMVHVFNADSGAEIFAYIPRAVLPNLLNLADPGYAHRYFVDGGISVETITEGAATKVIAIGTLGFGGQALYALDLTTLASPSAANVLWERGESDFSSTPCSNGYGCSDLGYIPAPPAIKQLEDGNWWAIFGNGYNSDKDTRVSQRGEGVVYLLKAWSGDTATMTVLHTNTNAGSDPRRPATDYNNAVAEPFVADINGNDKGDAIYAGDIFGNLWKWKWVNSAWTPALGLGNPLFVAQAGADGTTYAGRRQSITSRPVVGRKGGQDMIFFGTGKYLETPDAVNTSSDLNITQSIYGIYDNQPALLARGDLQTRSIVAEGKDSNGVWKRAITSEAMATGKKGWYLDLWGVTNSTLATGASAQRKSWNEGERVVANPYLRFDTLTVTSSIPSPDACEGDGSSWYYEFDAFTGRQSNYQNIDPTLSSWGDNSTVRRADDGLGTNANLSSVGMIVNETGGKKPKEQPSSNPEKGRLSWRLMY